MISYSTNWMGPCGMWWFQENGFTEQKTAVLDRDIPLTNNRQGDIVKYENITEYWYGGRIDIYGLPDDEYYDGKSELALPIMDQTSWVGFSSWLERHTTETVWTLKQLVEEYERTHERIVWFNHEVL